MTIYQGKPNPDSDHADRDRRVLPLDHVVERLGRGWRVRLPVRAEQVTVNKRTFVAEEVVVRARPVEDVVRVDETVRREELRVDTSGVHADVTEPYNTAFESGRSPGATDPRSVRTPLRDD